MLSLLNPLRGHSRRCLLRQFHASRLLAAKKIENFRLADIGEGITECEIIKWSVKQTATVQAFDVLCEVQSDKASVEITSPFDGVIKSLLVKEGDVAKVGEGLCLIEVEEEEAAPADLPSAQDSPPVLANDVDVDPSSKHQVSSSPTTHEKPLPLSDSPPTRSGSLHPLDPKAMLSRPQQAGKVKTSAEVLSTPSVRHFAKQCGVDISELAPGSGKGGRIERSDVEAFLEGGTAGSSAAASPSTTGDGSDVVVELGRTRYAMWKAMTKSLEIPHFGYSTYLDVTNLHQMLPLLSANIPPQFLPDELQDHNAGRAVSQHAVYKPSSSASDQMSQYTRLTMLPLLLKTLAKAMNEWPLFRSSITPGSATSGPEKPTLTIRPRADVSIALSTPSGLYTPTIQGLDAMTPYEIMGSLRRLSNLGRQSPSGLGPKEMPKRGGTITVSNVGAIGQGEFASPILVPGGGVAIVALGRARWFLDVNEESELFSPGVGIREEGTLSGEKRLKMGVSWSADQRVVEGAELAAFMECWREWVEQPTRLIGEGR